MLKTTPKPPGQPSNEDTQVSSLLALPALCLPLLGGHFSYLYAVSRHTSQRGQTSVQHGILSTTGSGATAPRAQERPPPVESPAPSVFPGPERVQSRASKAGLLVTTPCSWHRVLEGNWPDATIPSPQPVSKPSLCCPHDPLGLGVDTGQELEGTS